MLFTRTFSKLRQLLPSIAILLGLIPFTLSACFDAPRPECAFACGEQGACPSGYRCVDDGWCKRDDVADSFSCSSVSLIDAAGPDGRADAALVDAALVDAALVDAAIDAALIDAAIDAALIDAAIDAAIDASIDAAVDASIDAAIDAS